MQNLRHFSIGAAAAASALNFPFAEVYCWWVAVQFFQSGADTKGSLLFRA
jgi:hypothetical protein